MDSGTIGGNAQKQDSSVFVGIHKPHTNLLQEDGIRKELYENERKARENWAWKWGFFKNAKKMCKKEALKRGLLGDFDAVTQKIFPSSSIEKIPTKIMLQPSKGVPQKCSGMIGWRSSPRENNLELLVGPMYVSPKLTMNPPLGPAEPDLRYQKIIFLG